MDEAAWRVIEDAVAERGLDPLELVNHLLSYGLDRLLFFLSQGEGEDTSQTLEEFAAGKATDGDEEEEEEEAETLTISYIELALELYGHPLAIITGDELDQAIQLYIEQAQLNLDPADVIVDYGTGSFRGGGGLGGSPRGANLEGADYIDPDVELVDQDCLLYTSPSPRDS